LDVVDGIDVTFPLAALTRMCGKYVFAVLAI